MLKEWRVTLRGLMHKPMFAMIAVLTMALGIGANTAIFSVFQGVLLRDLPYRNPDKLVSIGELSAVPGSRNIGFMTMLDWKARAHAFESMAVYRTLDMALSGDGVPEQVTVLQGSGDFLDTLGVSPGQGRGWTPEEATPNADHVVVLSHGFWQRRFGGDPSILGRLIILNEIPYQVVGIMPASFRAYFAEAGDSPIAALSPLRYAASYSDACRTCRHLRAIARVRDDFTIDGARQDLIAVHTAMSSDFPADYKASRPALLDPLHDTLVDTTRRPLGVILAAGILLLVATCVNVSVLMLIRATQRYNELSVRAILGAGSIQLLRQCLLESFTITIAGGAAGILIAEVMTPVLIRLAPGNIPMLDAVSINTGVLAVALTATLVAGTAVAVVPSWQILRRLTDLDLRPAARSVIGARGGGVRRALVVSGLACTFVLLVVVGLLLRSMDRLMNVDPGFRSERLVTMNINSVSPRYPRPEDDIRFFQNVVKSVRAQAGIEGAAAVSVLPISGNYDRGPFPIEGRPDAPESIPSADRYVVTPNYLAMMGIPVLRGRGFTDRDTADAPKVLLIGETAARSFFGNEDPLGKRVRVQDDWASIIGVVGDVHQYQLDLSPTPQFYLPLAQQSRGYMTLVVRSPLPADETVQTVTRAVLQVDSTRALSRVATLDRLVADSEATRRFVLGLIAGYGALAAFLAAVGTYGTFGFMVATRRKEIGIRMALGAQRSQIRELFLRQVLGCAGPALLFGGLLIAAAGPLIRGVLFEVGSLDPVVVVLSGGALTLIALVGSLAPIHRAMQVDPNTALREE
jgi:putative ABC transport system permease protein